ncbi:MAG: hypothetical protein WC775_06130 [Patescibacteria group bacterium]|jgi:hypothetical protein
MNVAEGLHIDRDFVEALYGSHRMVPTEVIIAQRVLNLIEMLSSGAYPDRTIPITDMFDHPHVAMDFFGGTAIARSDIRTGGVPIDNTVISSGPKGDGFIYHRQLTADDRAVACIQSQWYRRNRRFPLRMGVHTLQLEMPSNAQSGKHLSTSDIAWADPRFVEGSFGYLSSFGSVHTNPQTSEPLAFSWNCRILPPTQEVLLTTRHSKYFPNGVMWKFAY